MNIEFDEKTFEKHFGHELARKTNITFSLGQVDEYVFGFDEAFWIPEKILYLVIPYIRRARREKMRGVGASDLNHIEEALSRQMLNLRFNVFIQFKRPVYLRSTGAKQWSDWRRNYYRYPITPHQQAALEKIEDKSYGRAAAVYAGPAFWSIKELWAHVGKRAVVDHSNMTTAGNIKGHGHYSYTSPGFVGKAHSESVDIVSDPLMSIIEVGLRQNEPLPFGQRLKKAAVAIMEAVDDSAVLSSIFYSARDAYGIGGFERESLISALEVIEVFSDAFGINYYAMG